MTDDQNPTRGDDGLDLAARMQRATAHVDGRGVRADAIPGRSEQVVVGARRRRFAAAAAVVALIAGGAVAIAARNGDEPQEVTTAAPTSVPEVGPDDQANEDTVSDGEPTEDPTTGPSDDRSGEQPTRLWESGPKIPLGPCSETYPVPSETIGLEARVLIYGMGQALVELRNTTEEDMVVLNGGRYVALGDDGNIHTDVDDDHNQGYGYEDEEPTASVVVPAGGTGEIRTPLTLVQATVSCPGMPSLWSDVENQDRFEFVYLLGIEGSDEVYASEADILTINGDGSATCAEAMSFDPATGMADCPRPADWSPGS